MNRDNLGIEIQASLDKDKSRNNISNDIKNLEKTPFFIRLIAKLYKSLSNANIKNDIKALEKSAPSIRLNGRLNRATTRRNIRNDADSLANSANVTLGAQIDRNELQQSVDTARNDIEQNLHNNPINVPININGNINNGAQQVQNLNNQMRNAEGILGNYLTAREIFRIIANSIKQVVNEVESLNKAQTDLQIATSKSAAEMKSLMQDYNQLAKQMSSTTLDVTGAADDFLRQGRSIADTNTLVKDSLVLSKIGQLESAESTQYLTSAMKGYQLQANEVINIVDKLSATDMAAAVSAGGLAEAMSKCANSASTAGVSMDSLIGYIATVAEVTQKSDSVVGESFKTIMARMGKIRLNDWIDDDGTDISGEINDVEKTLGKFDIALRKSATEFRDFEDVIYDVGMAWDKFSSVDKNAIANAFGGVYQRENVLTLFNNFSRAMELAEVSANSAGTAMEKFSIYENSLEAATNRLTASLEGLAYNTIDGDFLKGLANATAGIVEFVDSTKLLKTGLTAGIFTGAVAGLVALGTRMVAVRNNVTQFTQAMNLSRSTTALTENQVTQLTGYVNGLSRAQLRCVVSSRQLNDEQRISILTAAGLTRAEAQAQLQTWNLTNATNTQTGATFSLRGAWEGLKASIASNPIGLIVTALTLATTAITTVKQKQEELRQSISETAREAKEQTDSLNDLIKSYEEFADKTSYTAEEKERLKSIQEQLVDTYHTEADGIDLVNGKYDEEIAKLKELKKEKLKDAELSLTAEREQAKNDGSYENLSNKSFDISADWFNSEDDYNKIIQELDKRVSGFTTDISLISKGLGVDSQINIFAGNAEYRIKEIKKAMEVLKEYGYTNIGLYSELNDLLSEYQGYVDTENEAVSNLAENMLQQYELDNPYNKVGKDSYLAWRDGLLATAKGDNDLKSALLNLAIQQFPDYEKYFDNLTKAKSMFVRANSASEASWAKEKDNLLFGLSDEDLAIAVQIPDLFAEGLEGATAKIEAWKSDPNNKITPEVDTKPLEELQEAYDELSKSASSYVSNQKSITSALEEQEKYGQLSAKTIQELTDAGYAQALVVDSETGAVTLNKQAYEQLNREKKQAIILEAKQQKTDLEQKYKNERSAISDLTLEMQYANEERRKAITLEIAQHSQNMAEYANMIDKINGDIVSLDAPTFGNDDKSKPKSVTDFEKELARRQHEINMGRMSEDEDYYNWLDSEAKTAYEGLADYEDELFKYQEQVYKGRQKLAESYFNKRISDLKEYAETVENTSITSDGTKLNTSEKWREIADIYREIQNEIENRINEIVEAGAEGNKDLLDELNKQYEEYSQKISDTFKSAVKEEQDLVNSQKDKYSKLYDERISKIKEQQEAAKKAADTEIDALESKIDYLKKVNDERTSELEIEKARQELEKSKQRTRKVYGENGTVSYEQDKEATAEANKNLNELLLKQQITALENEKSVLESIRDTESESYSQIIETLEKEQEEGERQFDILLQALDKYLNPNNTTSNADVWSELAKTEGAKYSNGTWKDKDGNIINVNDLLKNANKTDNINTDSLFKNENMQGAESSYDKIMVKLLKNMSAPQTTIDKFLKGEFTPEMMYLFKPNASNPFEAQHNSERWSRGIDDYKLANNSTNITSTFTGDININAPVGNSNDLAKELMMNLPNAFQNQMYTNLK